MNILPASHIRLIHCRMSHQIKSLIISFCCSWIFLSSHSFGQKPSDKIDLYYPNIPLLEHLIKSDIDSVRKQQHLPFLYNDSICYLAARDHSLYSMDMEDIRHFQDDLSKKTPKNRVEYYGAEGYEVGENIAKIYLHTPFSYQIGVAPAKTMSVSTYEDAAKFIVSAWVNSAEHYVNILSAIYDVTGVAAVVNEDDKSLICVQVFAEVDSNYTYKAYPDLFPYDNLIADREKYSESLQPGRKDCNKQTWNIEAPADKEETAFFDSLIGNAPKWFIIYNDRDVYLNMGRYESAVRLFSNKYDGLALEIIPYEVYDCSKIHQSLYSGTDTKDCLFRGEVTKPLYLDKLFRKKLDSWRNHDMEYRYFIPYVGKIPDKISEPYEVNVIFLKNNKVYKIIQSHHLCGEVPDHLIKIPLYTGEANAKKEAANKSLAPADTIPDSDSLAATEYLQLFNLISEMEQTGVDTGESLNNIRTRMDSIQQYLFERFLENKLDFETIDALPALMKDNDGYYNRNQPLAKLYYNRIIFKYNHLKDELPDTTFQQINESMRNFKNPLPMVQYNYYAMLISKMNGKITQQISLANLREISDIIQRIEGKISQKYLDSLKVFYHFQRILKYYADGMFNYRRMYPSLQFIHDYFKTNYLSPEGRVKLARFYIHLRLYDFAYDIILPAAGFDPYYKDAFVLYLKIYYSGLIKHDNKENYYENILNASDILPVEEWLNLFHDTCRINFQLLDYEPLRGLYCAKKKSLEIRDGHNPY